MDILNNLLILPMMYRILYACMHPHNAVTLETLTDVRTFCEAGSPISMLPFKSNRTLVGLGKISGGGAKMSCPLSSLHLASERCFFNFSSSFSSVPLSSRCFATSGREMGFFGETLSSSPNEIWLIPEIACWQFEIRKQKLKHGFPQARWISNLWQIYWYLVHT